MDRFLGYLLEKLSSFFTVTTYVERVEFASHIGWSIAIPALCEAFAEERGLYAGLLIAIFNTMLAEFWVDGHFLRVWKSRESRHEFRDFTTDFLTKFVPAALYVLLKLREVTV